jgi:N-acetylglucosaminyl-diphospho-decaprenol L-rhamnosyltransferase
MSGIRAFALAMESKTSSMPNLDVATVIVTYRTAQLTIKCLRSIQSERQIDGLSIRVIVVDNASGDAPAIEDAIEANGWASWVTLISAPKNGGFGYGNNLGIQRAYETHPPDYVHVLNPDTVLRPAAISSLVRFLEANPHVGIAGSSYECLDGSDWPIAFRFPSLLSELSYGLQMGVVARLFRRWTVARPMSKIAQPTDWVSGASMMIRPAVLVAIGGFDENYFLYFEETDFCHRAHQAGFATWYVPESRVMHIMGQSTKVTDEKSVLERYPPYWFESRRRYFVVRFGIGRAIAIDIVAVLANSLGLLKRTLQLRSGIPHYIRDLLKHSILWPRNRDIPAARCFRPRG